MNIDVPIQREDPENEYVAILRADLERLRDERDNLADELAWTKNEWASATAKRDEAKAEADTWWRRSEIQVDTIANLRDKVAELKAANVNLISHAEILADEIVLGSPIVITGGTDGQS